MRGKLLIGLGALAFLLGGVWTLQGAGVIGGSFMTNSQTWLVIGLILAIIGIVLLVEGARVLRRRT
ncbi:hypothetical protein [Actinophytocola sp.]|uniref:hypothetical protein n=1 Tax=Actinophytocola sp. TaxID=1872138 RepID=UPI002D7E6256|nr:hypothetical protein [Actinophytocola sp.]HET9137926.1 hypothetical protein [Actinophytocola sp.]